MVLRTLAASLTLICVPVTATAELAVSDGALQRALIGTWDCVSAAYGEGSDYERSESTEIRLKNGTGYKAVPEVIEFEFGGGLAVLTLRTTFRWQVVGTTIEYSGARGEVIDLTLNGNPPTPALQALVNTWLASNEAGMEEMDAVQPNHFRVTDVTPGTYAGNDPSWGYQSECKRSDGELIG